MNNEIQIDILRENIAEFCQKHHIRKLSLFGSVLREDFHPESDVDVLVEFEAGAYPRIYPSGKHGIGIFQIIWRA